MNILIINGTIDCSGGKILLCKGINKYTKHTCRHLVAEENYMQFETDIILKKYDHDFFFEVDRLVRRADVLWFHMWDFNKPYGLINWRHYLEGKRILFNGQSAHEPGKIRHQLYEQGRLYDYYRNTPVQPVSFHANELVYEGTKWAPIFKPIHDKEHLPENNKNFEGKLIIGQSPSTPFSKNTNELIEAFRILKNKGYDIELDIVTNVDYRESLRRKRKWHIAFDNMHQGHEGSSGWESASMAIPTFVKLCKEELGALTEWGEGAPPPFINIQNKDELLYELERLISDRDLLKKKSIETRAWLDKYHYEERIINRWIKIIDETPVWRNVDNTSHEHVLKKPLDLKWSAYRTRYHKIIWNIPQKKWFGRLIFLEALFLMGFVRKMRRFSFMKPFLRVLDSACWRSINIAQKILKTTRKSVEIECIR